jgi:putative transposase
MLCRIVGVAVSGFYARLRRGPGRRREDDRRMGARLAAIVAGSRGTYGSPRVHAELRAEGVRVGRKRVARLMREMGLCARRGRRRAPRTTDSRHDLPVAPNLLDRKFAADRPDAVWLADISYIPTGEGWLYLAAIKDMATREIVGWSMADHLGAELARDALLMAIRRRQPPPGLIHHSDRGVQYASGPYRATLARHGLVQSMSRKGNCLDNAPMESFFGSLKSELVHRASFPTREAARRAIFEYVETSYNRRRRHSGLGFLTPAQAYEQMARAA